MKVSLPIKSFALVALGVTTMSLSAFAASVSYSTTVPSTDLSFTSSALSFQQFDPTLGTLTSIEFTVSGNAATTTTAENLDSVTEPYILSVGAKLKLETAATGGVVLNENVSVSGTSLDIASEDTQVIHLSGSANSTSSYDGATGAFVSGSGTLASSINLSDFIGTGTYSLFTLGSIYSSNQIDGANNTTNVGSAGATVTVTYNYTTIPEPTTWAMLMGGIGMVTVGRRMWKRKA
jgi:hypothetical protein